MKSNVFFSFLLAVSLISPLSGRSDSTYSDQLKGRLALAIFSLSRVPYLVSDQIPQKGLREEDGMKQAIFNAFLLGDEVFSVVDTVIDKFGGSTRIERMAMNAHEPVLLAAQETREEFRKTQEQDGWKIGFAVAASAWNKAFDPEVRRRIVSQTKTIEITDRPIYWKQIQYLYNQAYQQIKNYHYGNPAFMDLFKRVSQFDWTKTYADPKEGFECEEVKPYVSLLPKDLHDNFLSPYLSISDDRILELLDQILLAHN